MRRGGDLDAFCANPTPPQKKTGWAYSTTSGLEFTPWPTLGALILPLPHVPPISVSFPNPNFFEIKIKIDALLLNYS